MSEKSISKQMKTTGKATFKGPQVKERKPFAPATKVEAPKKGKGSYNRKDGEEDEQHLGEVPMKPDHWDKSKKKTGKFDKLGKKIKDKIGGLVNKSVSGGKIDENVNIEKFIDCILTKNYASADKYIKQAVEDKIQLKIEKELSTPLF